MPIEIMLGDATAQTIAHTIRGGAEQNINTVREALNKTRTAVEEMKNRANQQELDADRLLKQYELTTQVARKAQDRYQAIQYKAELRPTTQDASVLASAIGPGLAS